MIFLDTNVIVSYAIETDANHIKADRIMSEISSGKYGNLFISNFIFDESVTVIFVRSKNLMTAIKAGENLKISTEILEVDKSMFEDAWKTFKSQKGVKFSFTDCTTIEVMRRNSIKVLATFDEDFLKVKEINVMGAD